MILKNDTEEAKDASQTQKDQSKIRSLVTMDAIKQLFRCEI